MSRAWILGILTLGVVAGSAEVSFAGADEVVPLYTREDLDRMFGPPPPPVSDPVLQAGPQDWVWVESYLDRQYARLDADRDYELSRRTLDIEEARAPAIGYRYPAAFGLNYPASTWWGVVQSRYWAGGLGGNYPGRYPSVHAAPRGNGRGNGHGNGRIRR